MEHNILSMDFWQDTVTYEGQTIPTGTLGCAALNIPDAVIDKLDELCSPINGFMKTLTSGMPDPALLPASKEAAENILKLLHTVPPFDCLDMDFYIPNICKAFTLESICRTVQPVHSVCGCSLPHPVPRRTVSCLPCTPAEKRQAAPIQV